MFLPVIIAIVLCLVDTYVIPMASQMLVIPAGFSVEEKQKPELLTSVNGITNKLIILQVYRSIYQAVQQ